MPFQKGGPGNTKATGRPSKLTPQLQETVCEALRRGNYMTVALKAAGVDETTAWGWVTWGRESAKAGIVDKYSVFVKAVEEAVAEAEQRLVDLWMKDSEIPGNWQSKRDLLARRHRERWGRTEEVKLSGAVETNGSQTLDVTGRIVVAGIDLTNIPDEEIEEAIKKLERIDASRTQDE